jgi:hypothetical protein
MLAYGYSDCSERFQMDERLDQEARACAVLARICWHYSVLVVELPGTTKPVCLGMESGGQRMN